MLVALCVKILNIHDWGVRQRFCGVLLTITKERGDILVEDSSGEIGNSSTVSYGDNILLTQVIAINMT